MDTPLQVAVTLLNALMAVVYYMVGRTVMARRPAGDGRAAATSFAIWWYALALVQSGSIIDFAVRHTVGWSLAWFLGYLQLILLALVLALAALMYYLVYLYTGRRGAWRLIAVAYTLYFVALLYFVAASDPAGVSSGPFGTDIDYANDLSETTFAQVIGLLLIVPIIVAAVGYFSLFFKAPERSQKFRIAVVGTALIVWFGSSLVVGQFTDYAETPGWRLVAPMIALMASTMVYIAFRPPLWLQARFHIRGYGAH